MSYLSPSLSVILFYFIVGLVFFLWPIPSHHLLVSLCGWLALPPSLLPLPLIFYVHVIRFCFVCADSTKRPLQHPVLHGNCTPIYPHLDSCPSLCLSSRGPTSPCSSLAAPPTLVSRTPLRASSGSLFLSVWWSVMTSWPISLVSLSLGLWTSVSAVMLIL